MQPQLPVYDVAIIGAGYGGFLSALLLNARGKRVIIIEKEKSPGEKLGEAFTPELGTMIRLLAAEYRIPQLVHLSNYTGVKRHFPGIPAFPKKYFHFAFIERGSEFLNESARWPLPSDLHVSRRLYDGALGDLVAARGIRVEYGAELKAPERHAGHFQLHFGGKSAAARFLLDASGPGTYLARSLNLLVNPGAELRTSLRFTHIKKETAWPTKFTRSARSEGKIHGTGHYVFDRGWMWYIPFGNGVTSIGIHSRTDGPYSGQKPLHLEDLTRMNPRFAGMFRHAETVFDWREIQQVQYRSSRAAGDGFAMLPASTYGNDALLSSGLVTTTHAIRRLVPLIVEALEGPGGSAGLDAYERTICHEAELLDLYVHSLYISFPDPELFNMLYALFRFGTFVAGITVLLDPKRLNEVWYLQDHRIERAIRQCHDLLKAAESRREIGTPGTREKLRNVLEPGCAGTFLKMTEASARDGFYPFPYLRWIFFLLRDPFFPGGFRWRIMQSLAGKYWGLFLRYL